MSRYNIDTEGRSSMLRRKVYSTNDTDNVDMSLALNMHAEHYGGDWVTSGTLWVKDAEGRTQVLTLPHDMLMAIRDGINLMEQKETLKAVDPNVLKKG